MPESNVLRLERGVKSVQSSPKGLLRHARVYQIGVDEKRGFKFFSTGYVQHPEAEKMLIRIDDNLSLGFRDPTSLNGVRAKFSAGLDLPLLISRFSVDAGDFKTHLYMHSPLPRGIQSKTQLGYLRADCSSYYSTSFSDKLYVIPTASLLYRIDGIEDRSEADDFVQGQWSMGRKDIYLYYRRARKPVSFWWLKLPSAWVLPEFPSAPRDEFFKLEEQDRDRKQEPEETGKSEE